MNIIILALLFIVLIALFLVLHLLISDKKEYESIKNKKSNINTDINLDAETLKILLEKDSIEKIDGTLDQLITDAIKTYSIFNVSIEGAESYINSVEIKQMSKYVYASVKKNITPAILYTIKLIHKIDTEKDLDDLLNLKIKIHILATTVNNNTILE